MDGYSVYGATGMPRGSLLLIEHGRGMQIELWDGELWITQEGDTRDHVVRGGTSFRVEHEGIVLANSLKGARITLTAPVPAHYAERITLTLAGSAPRVLYERARERGGRLGGIGHRIVRYWTNQSAPQSSPITAALQKTSGGLLMKTLPLPPPPSALSLAAGCNPADSVSE